MSRINSFFKVFISRVKLAVLALCGKIKVEIIFSDSAELRVVDGNPGAFDIHSPEGLAISIRGLKVVSKNFKNTELKFSVSGKSRQQILKEIYHEV